MSQRSAVIRRRTLETDIEMVLSLDGTGSSRFDSGIPFMDHLLSQTVFFGMFDLSGSARGDLEVDAHHTLEDTALCLGSAIASAMGDRTGIRRFGWACIPMDDALVSVSVDAGGRPWAGFSGRLPGRMPGGIEPELIEHFIRSFAFSASVTLHVEVREGRDPHHVSEALFKALGVALREALEADPRRSGTASTKGAS
ncbi:imidazoleglycerol-phosphate dehydratase [Candidatus Fermentibacteria bacterium]|nr:imidazoleglycerol-phosphate dehydratase [Candidatus Fermentibacteria bacterium]